MCHYGWLQLKKKVTVLEGMSFITFICILSKKDTFKFYRGYLPILCIHEHYSKSALISLMAWWFEAKHFHSKMAFHITPTLVIFVSIVISLLENGWKIMRVYLEIPIIIIFTDHFQKHWNSVSFSHNGASIYVHKPQREIYLHFSTHSFPFSHQ